MDYMLNFWEVKKEWWVLPNHVYKNYGINYPQQNRIKVTLKWK